MDGDPQIKRHLWYMSIIHNAWTSFGFWLAKVCPFLFHKMVLIVLSYLQLHSKQFCQMLSYHHAFKKKNMEIGECIAILILKMEEKNISLFVLYHFKKGKNATETRFVQCMKKVRRLQNMSKVICQVSCWAFRAR